MDDKEKQHVESGRIYLYIMGRTVQPCFLATESAIRIEEDERNGKEDENMNTKNRIELYKKLVDEYSNQLPGVMNDDFLDWLIDEGFFTAPALKKYHGCI